MKATRPAHVSPGRRGDIWRGPYILRWWAYFWIVLTVVAWLTPSSAGLLICGGVALHSLRGTRESAEALGILAFLIVLGKTDITLGRWLVLFAALGRTLWDGIFGGKPVPRLIYPLFVFFVVILILSIVASAFPLISGLKVTSFTLGVAVTLTSLYRTRHHRDYWLSWLFTVGLFILFASIPFFGLEAGYTVNDTGFQGILVHPQTFGPVVASITALLTGLYFLRDRTSWVILLSVGIGWLGVYLSLARTAFLALLLAGGVTAFIAYFKPTTWATDFSRAANRPIVIVGLFVCVSLGALQWSSIHSTVENYLTKGGGSVSLVESLEQSRGALMNASMANFWEEPLTGIGFGAPSDPYQFAQQVERGPYGIPLSASVEKGFMPTAVLGETGVVGAILTIILLMFLLSPAVYHPDPTLFWVMMTCLLVNFGEMVFFSIGGMGFFLWFVMAFCHVAALETRGGDEAVPTPAPAQAGRVRR